VLGVAPVNVTFSASNSISGVTAQSTNNVGITGYTWNFGDGSVTGSATPFVTHNFLSAGTWPITLTVTNSSGGTASYTQTYRTIGSTNAVVRPAPPTNLRFP
jgi:PKD repeat protein